jgi:DNA-binding NarL/FixJ family response regulator
MIVAAVGDLLFASKIRAAARAIGVEVRFARTAEELLALAARGPRLVVIDLNGRDLDPLAAIERIKEATAGACRVVGFVSHVQTDLIAAARRAGADEVLARSAFAARLPVLLRPATNGQAAEDETSA